MDDLISRQAAIDAVRHAWAKGLEPTQYLEELPSAQKTGTWIDRQEGKWIYAKCNKCGTTWDAKSNYCPNCGAKMESDNG